MGIFKMFAVLVITLPHATLPPTSIKHLKALL